jgi:2-dehydro-3-deoxyphosphogluconate aldolase/(4S)-4-hydroxy-2-oxoglutarate aldolase
MSSDLFDRIAAIGVVPVIAIENAAQAVPLADALLEGGLPLAEITFRTTAAAEVIATLRDKRPELLVGAGTILDSASLDAAKASGALFGLAPGYDAEIVAEAGRIGLPFAPGIMTPSELGAALKQGARLCKFFPAGIAGGPTALAGISTPFAHLGCRFIPTGGVTEANLPDWLAVKDVLAVGGTWIATTIDIANGRWAEIAAKARAAVARVREARGG